VARRGSLLDAEAVAAEWVGVFRTIRASLLRVPKRAAARHFISPDQVLELDAEIREVLTDLETEGSRHDEAAAATAGD
jgi:phage terminase Nu1 subunit (DNA packaging protein)